jgi:signal transduction histidine kinase
LYFYFRITKISEQNKLWAGMAKETAHQIGTPLTSLMGWTSLIKERGLKNNSILEIEKDIKRLEIITERFSKIGSLPDLKESNLVDLILDTINYLKKRNSKYLKWEYIHDEKKIKIPVNEILFSWTLENIINNSIDSMKGKGKIKIVLKNEERLIRLLIVDSGKGIPRKNFKLIFNPGFTTKKKGWGLGLSLSKRIIEDYHKGILRIKKSIIGKGTNFEIIIKK